MEIQVLGEFVDNTSFLIYKDKSNTGFSVDCKNINFEIPLSTPVVLVGNRIPTMTAGVKGEVVIADFVYPIVPEYLQSYKYQLNQGYSLVKVKDKKLHYRVGKGGESIPYLILQAYNKLKQGYLNFKIALFNEYDSNRLEQVEPYSSIMVKVKLSTKPYKDKVFNNYSLIKMWLTEHIDYSSSKNLTF